MLHAKVIAFIDHNAALVSINNTQLVLHAKDLLLSITNPTLKGGKEVMYNKTIVPVKLSVMALD